VICTKNHDQIGNRALGDRPAAYLNAAQQRLWAALMLVSPYVPLIFMGEEYAESRPFPFFCSFEDPQLVEAVRAGRRREFEELQFRWGGEIPDPQAEETFRSAVLSWSWPQGSRSAGLRTLHRDLLRARRHWRGLRDRTHTHAMLLSAVPGTDEEEYPVLLLERGRHPTLQIVANLTCAPARLPDEPVQREDLLFSSEAARYGGRRTVDDTRRVDQLLPHEVLIFGAGEPFA
jgi:maltooligosyltrehalose trehalohydrolase